MSTTLRLTRAAFGAVQRAAPDLAARWAERIFCSPPRRPISERMAAWLRDGQRFDVIVGSSRRPRPRRVTAWAWGERGPAVLLVHGVVDCKGFNGRGGSAACPGCREFLHRFVKGVAHASVGSMVAILEEPCARGPGGSGPRTRPV